MSGLVLMENAGRGVADVLCALAGDAAVAICCGKGNNGGDGFFSRSSSSTRAAVRVRVLLLADPYELTGDGATNFHVLSEVRRVILGFGAFAAGRQPFVRQLSWPRPTGLSMLLLGTGVTGSAAASV